MTKNAARGQFLTDVQSQIKSWISDGPQHLEKCSLLAVTKLGPSYPLEIRGTRKGLPHLSASTLLQHSAHSPRTREMELSSQMAMTKQTLLQSEEGGFQGSKHPD